MIFYLTQQRHWAFAAAGKRIVELQIPATVNILAVKKGAMFIAPNGSTKLMPNNVLHGLAEDRQSIELLNRNLDLKLLQQ